MAAITKRKDKFQVKERLASHPTITKTFNLRTRAIQWKSSSALFEPR